MSDYNPCCFCLGGDTDVPPFGKLEDAQDFVEPCERCSLTTHRKCLLDWFNSLPADKLKVMDCLFLTNTTARHSGEHSELHSQYSTPDSPGEEEAQEEEIPTVIAENADEWGLALSYFEIRLSGQLLNRLMTTMSSGLGSHLSSEGPLAQGRLVLLVASCPQCKGDVTFSMKRSQLLALNSGVRTLVTRTVQAGCVFTILASAVTGVLSMSYIGLSTCGLKIMDSIVPGPLLVNILRKPTIPGASLTLLFDLNSYSVDTMEMALSRGIIDPFKFSRIPVLPLVLYRMRSSSLISCIVGSTGSRSIHSTTGSTTNNTSTNNNTNNTDNIANHTSNNANAWKDTSNNMQAWITEIMINGYISGLGNHELAQTIFSNFMNSKSLLAKVDFWNVNNMISMIIPLRWLYDLLYRLTLNRMHFNLTMKIRPRDIANSLDPIELDHLEQLGSNIANYEGDFAYLYKKAGQIVDSESRNSLPSFFSPLIKLIKRKVYYYQACQKSDLPLQYLRARFASWMAGTKACIKHDYSTTLLYKSFTLRCVTSILWPFLSSKVGSILFKSLLKYSRKFDHIPKSKLLLLANIIGLLGVVFIKDCFNLYLCSKKANQISDMLVMSDVMNDLGTKVTEFANIEAGEYQDPEIDDFSFRMPGGYSLP